MAAVHLREKSANVSFTFPFAIALCLLALCYGNRRFTSTPAGGGKNRISSAVAASSAVISNTSNASATPYECLRMTTPEVTLAYPTDAVEHTRKIHEAMKDWVGSLTGGGNYTGRFMEGYWMQQYNLSSILSDASGKALKENFGMYIPLLVPWTELWVGLGHRYPTGLIPTLKEMTRSDVPYVTVVQSDLGLVGKCNEGFNHGDFPNILVFSAGGYGHVPIPLLQLKYGLREETSDVTKASELKYLASFLGSSHTATANMRGRMCATAHRVTVSIILHNLLGDVWRLAARWMGRSSAQVGASFSMPRLRGKGSILCAKRNDWLHVSAISRASLAPRGFGRTSFRLSEVIRYGLIPIYVYDDLPWLPYPEKWDGIGWTTDIPGLSSAMTEVAQLSGEEVLAMRQRVSLFGQSHFTIPAVMDQITRFMVGADGSGRQPAGDLRCVVLPECPQNNVKRNFCSEECRWKS